ncbi:hypothetical protein SAMN02745166_02247 [Prosthecobacter debontii]|uniref:Uncharacterized protein n=1 Tax=Prosthecobacter debontii TaxID=48467 RepID=A0A1T4XZD9_9BACT|nr:hypothetical protein [Prosthecobacter debontii]SKA94934.1 hypothetical protein SAMN02745166_02247 [Prosthecobacter debontii]
MKQHLSSQARGGVLRAIHRQRGFGFVLLSGLLSVAMACAATSWDTSALKTLSSPAERSFPDGYEVVSEPNLGAGAIKKMPAGDAMVAAYLDVGSRRYYMSDWSYDRYRQGLSYNWIRPLLETSSMGSSALPEEGVSQAQGQVQELHVGAPLSRWLPHLVAGEDLKFLDLDEGKRMLYGEFEWRDRVVTVLFSIPSDITSLKVSDARFRTLPSTMVKSVPKIWPSYKLRQLSADGDIIMGFLEGMGSGDQPWVNVGQQKQNGDVYYAKKSGSIQAIVHLALIGFQDDPVATGMEVMFQSKP